MREWPKKTNNNNIKTEFHIYLFYLKILRADEILVGIGTRIIDIFFLILILIGRFKIVKLNFEFIHSYWNWNYVIFVIW